MTAARCTRCERRLPPGRTTYCRDRCRREAKRQRYLDRHPSIVAELRRREAEATERKLAWQRFARAHDPGTRLRVPPDAPSQQQARQLIAAGMCAFESVEGLVRDVGKPRSPKNAGAVWSRRFRVGRDAQGRVMT